MIFKNTLSIEGDKFLPNKVIDNIAGDLIVESLYYPNDRNDRKWRDSFEEYGYGGILFWHPKKFTLDDTSREYNTMFLEFIKMNYKFFSENGVEEWCLYIEIYYDGGQCNFEIFDREFLEVLSKFKVSIPMSVYCLNPEEYHQWVEEIKLEWRN
jgi:hypothetical protein